MGSAQAPEDHPCNGGESREDGNLVAGYGRQKSMAVERPTPLRLVALMAIALIATACGDDGAMDESADDTWGPLAVLSGPPNDEEALIAGSLHIGENCVTLEAGADEMVLLGWPSEGTSWDPQSRVIEYSAGNRTVELSHGEEVSFGGGSRSAAEWIDSVDGWASEPDPSCPTDWGWFVGALPPTDSMDS